MPLFRRRFSTPGHSGSWVIDKSKNKWIGLAKTKYQYLGATYMKKREMAPLF